MKQRAQNHALDDQHMRTECGQYTHLPTTAWLVKQEW